MNKRSGADRLIRSFGYALRGIHHALTRERNLRIHFAAGAFVLYCTRYYALSTAEMGVLALCIGFVVACETVNTAIERAVDLGGRAPSELARDAKDVAAGAVLVSAVTAVAIGFLLFWDIPTIKLVLLDQLAHPARSAAILAAAVLWIVFPVRKKT